MQPLLKQILEAKQEDVRTLYGYIDNDSECVLARAMNGELGPTGISLHDTLAKPGFHIIAEFKRVSPSKGALNTAVAIEQQVAAYLEHGAAAISVLTESTQFQGSLHDCQQVLTLVAERQVPVLRKDFIVDEIQLAESVVIGCDAVLLIAGILGDRLPSMLTRAQTLGIDVLLEVHSAEELAQARQLGAKSIGINNRDLNTFVVNPKHGLALIDAMGKADNEVLIGESGISDPSLAYEYQQAGFNGLLVGSVLMQAENPGAMLQMLRGGDNARAN